MDHRRHYGRPWTDELDYNLSPVEKELLAGSGFFSITQNWGIRNLYENYMSPMPTADEIWETSSTKPNSEGKQSRTLNNLALVLGPSGSGKTTFALRYVARRFQRKNPKKKMLALHIVPHETFVSFFLDKDHDKPNPEAAADLCDWIHFKLEMWTRGCVYDRSAKFKMHVCIIIDEAGNPHVKSWFESKAMLTKLYEEASKMAESVSVVILGNGLRGHELSSVDDAYIFRMKPWRMKDFVEVMTGSVYSFSLYKYRETIQTVANAVYAHPKLGALASHPHCAELLDDALADLCRRYSRHVWNLQLPAWTSAILTKVVFDYMEKRFQVLSPTQRLRITASVFHALHESKKSGTAVVQPFLALNHDEVAIAQALVDDNIELGPAGPRLVENAKSAMTVTPAIAIILYAIAGIPITVSPGGKAKDEIAALHVVHQMFLASMETFSKETSCDEQSLENINKTRTEVYELALEKLDKSLEQVKVVALQKPRETLASMSDKILVPMVGAGTILVNAGNPSFPDVIAPYSFIQTKLARHGSTLDVDLPKELEKVCLLKGSNGNDTRLLQGLVEMWHGNLELTGDSNLQSRGDQKWQNFKAFPENVARNMLPRDPLPYAVIEGDQISIGETKRRLAPLLDTTIISFVLSTDSEEILLRLSPEITLTVTSDNVGNDFVLNPDTLSENDRLVWTDFVTKHVREGTQIKFLLLQK